MAPPTLHCDEPAAGLGATRFRTTGGEVDWDVPPAVRVAAVNAFGFGGINTHAVLSAHPDALRRGGRALAPPARAHRPLTGTQEHPGGRVVLLADDDTAGLLAQLDAVDVERDDHRSAAPAPAAGPLRLAIVDPRPARIDLARRVVTGQKSWRGRNDVWFTSTGLVTAGGKLAFVFPGVEPNQAPDVADVAGHFGWELPERLGESELERQSRDILWAGRILHAAMDRLGVRPDLMAGHSLGEWGGLIAAGMVPDGIVDELSNGMLPRRLEVPDVVYLMVGAGVATASAAIEDLPGVAVSHDNCPHQSVLCGDTDGCAEAARRLRADGVLCQELPIRSGFHSPAFAPYLGPFRASFERIEFRPPSVPLWSATSVAPYPSDSEGVRELSLRHLVEPVRFRALAEALHDRAGVRVFVQMGIGSVPAFLDDTLHDRTVSALTAASPKRSTLAQLLRVAAGLWSEGVPVNFNELAVPGARSPRTVLVPAGQSLRLGVPLVHMEPGRPLVEPDATVSPAAIGGAGLDLVALGDLAASPVVAAYHEVMAETIEAGRQVMEAWASAGPVQRASAGSVLAPAQPASRQSAGRAGWGTASPAVSAAPEPVTSVSRRVFSVETDPQLLDHCFYRQPDGWPSHADRFPVVPMTMLLEVMADAARALVPDLPVVGFDDVRALRWLAVAPPVEVTVRAGLMEATPGGPMRVQVGIDGYAGATVLLDRGYAEPPERDPTRLVDEHEPAFTASEMYADRWMFHGPSYQGVTDLTAVAANGIRGVLADLPASGALLDCAGQLMGLWAMRATDTDRLALPTSIRRIRFFGPPPGVGVPVPCTVWITEHGPKVVRSDMELTVDDRVWARIDDWEDRRFESDEVVWPVLVYPETNVLSEEWVVPGSDRRVQLVRERWTSSASRDLMMRRYLGEEERAVYDRHHPRGQRTHLLGRMAAKDAVRRWHWSRAGGPLHPVQVQVANDAAGRPVVSGLDEVRLSIAHTEWVAVAVVADGPVGVDIERVEPKDTAFVDAALTGAEQALHPDRWSGDEWVLRVWTAKEAVAKARGTGLGGRPRSYEVERADDEQLTVRDPDGGRWQVATCRAGNNVVAVTVDAPAWPDAIDPGLARRTEHQTEHQTEQEVGQDGR
ncbi:MAG: 4'-phosphopantetheinyl transferase superfamily protein [Acidimicrobiales bacterium]